MQARQRYFRFLDESYNPCHLKLFEMLSIFDIISQSWHYSQAKRELAALKQKLAITEGKLAAIKRASASRSQSGIDTLNPAPVRRKPSPTEKRTEVVLVLAAVVAIFAFAQNLTSESLLFWPLALLAICMLIALCVWSVVLIRKRCPKVWLFQQFLEICMILFKLLSSTTQVNIIPILNSSKKFSSNN